MSFPYHTMIARLLYFVIGEWPRFVVPCCPLGAQVYYESYTVKLTAAWKKQIKVVSSNVLPFFQHWPIIIDSTSHCFHIKNIFRQPNCVRN